MLEVAAPQTLDIPEIGAPGAEELDAEHHALREQFREFAINQIAPLVPDDDEDAGFCAEGLRRAAEAGYCGILVPQEHGGLGLSNLALSLFLTEVARVCASTAVTLSVHNSLGASAVNDYGNEPTRAKYLQRLASGELLGAYALTEPASGSDASGLQTRAVLEGDVYKLTGTKLYVTSGDHAGLVVVFARTSDEEKKSRGISAFAVEPTFPGFSIGAKEDKLGLRQSSTVEIVLEGCEVPAENLLGEKGRGFPIALERLDGGRVGIASQALGMARRVLEEAVAAVARMQAAGNAQANEQWVHWTLAELATEVEAARMMIYRGARLRDARSKHTREGAMAKLVATRLANRAARECLAIVGLDGAGRNDVVARFFRDARITELYEGTTEIQKLVIARELLKAASAR